MKNLKTIVIAILTIIVVLQVVNVEMYKEQSKNQSEALNKCLNN